MFFHLSVRGMQDFVHTYRHSGRSQRAQSKNHAQYGNMQIFKNNIHGQGYQRVTKHRAKINPQGHLRLGALGLRRGRFRQRVQALFEPAKVEPCKDCADHNSRAPSPTVEITDGQSRQCTQEQSQPGNPALRCKVPRNVNAWAFHRRPRGDAAAHRASRRRTPESQEPPSGWAWYAANGPENTRSGRQPPPPPRAQTAAPWPWRTAARIPWPASPRESVALRVYRYGPKA